MASTRIIAAVSHPNRPAMMASPADGQDERLLARHAAARYGATGSTVGSDRSQSSASSSASSMGGANLADVTYRYMMYLYWLIPITLGLAFGSLVLLGRYAWPPTAKERSLPQPPPYPHPFLLQPFSIGVLASISVQALRRPIHRGVLIVLDAALGSTGTSSYRRHPNAVKARTMTVFTLVTSILATTLHTTTQELVRILTLYLISPLPHTYAAVFTPTTQLFQQSYHLGLGWGVAEAVWGIVKGWFAGMRLYVDVLPETFSSAREEADHDGTGKTAEQGVVVRAVPAGLGNADEALPGDEHGTTRDAEDAVVIVGDDQDTITDDDDDDDDDEQSDASADEEDLTTKIAILERLRGRRELEQILGIPFPNIALPLHLLWRLDALLLNLGLTLILSAYWYNIEPIYTRHSHRAPSGGDGQRPPFPPTADEGSERHHHRLFPLIVFAVVGTHVVVSLVWSLGVRKAGIGAVTWGSLIVSLGALFAGLGAWGALV